MKESDFRRSKIEWKISSITSLNNCRLYPNFTKRGEEWHKLIEKSVKNLHHQLDDLKKENNTALLKQKNDFEKLIGTVDGMIKKATELQKSKNITEMQKYRTVINEQLAEE